MADTNTVVDQYQVKYDNKWRNVLQQQSSRLREYATVDTGLTGEVKFYDQFGILDFEEKTDRMGKTNLKEAPTYRRSMRPTPFRAAYGYDEFDANQLGNLDVPLSKTMEGLRMAAGRRMDVVMIKGFMGTNYVGRDGVEKVEIPNEQIIAANYVESGTAAASNLTIGKLRATLQKFQENEAWSDDAKAAGDRLVCACTASQINALLRSVEIQSIDYNNVKALVNGEVDTFLGFKFIRIQSLPKTGNVREVLTWVKSRAQFGIWEDLKLKLSIRDDLDEALQLRAKFACGATRLEEDGFVKILCDETK